MSKEIVSLSESQDSDLARYVIQSGHHPSGMGYQILMRFPNRYGASIVRTPFSYGGREGKFELAVLRWSGENSSIDYTTPITDDVLGYLEKGDVLETLRKIKELK